MNAFEIAALSMNDDMRRLSVIGQNLANVATPGYKRVVQASRPFIDLMTASAVDSRLDTQAGTLRTSKNPLDLAIDGAGFFAFDTPQGQALSRQATLHVDGQGQLVNDAGMTIQSDRGALRVALPAQDLRVDAQGQVWSGDRSIGQLRLVQVKDPSGLEPLGGGLYREAEGDAPQAIETQHVLSGQREGSNVSSSAEMVRLMETTRHFEAMAKVVQGYDDAVDRAIRKLGELGS